MNQEHERLMKQKFSEYDSVANSSGISNGGASIAPPFIPGNLVKLKSADGNGPIMTVSTVCSQTVHTKWYNEEFKRFESDSFLAPTLVKVNKFGQPEPIEPLPRTYTYRYGGLYRWVEKLNDNKIVMGMYSITNPDCIDLVCLSDPEFTWCCNDWKLGAEIDREFFEPLPISDSYTIFNK